MIKAQAEFLNMTFSNFWSAAEFRHTHLPSQECACVMPAVLGLHFPKFPSVKISCDIVFFFASLAHFLDTGVSDPFRENYVWCSICCRSPKVVLTPRIQWFKGTYFQSCNHTETMTFAIYLSGIHWNESKQKKQKKQLGKILQNFLVLASSGNQGWKTD